MYSHIRLGSSLSGHLVTVPISSFFNEMKAYEYIVSAVNSSDILQSVQVCYHQYIEYVTHYHVIRHVFI
jgi:hypothetical protein